LGRNGFASASVNRPSFDNAKGKILCSVEKGPPKENITIMFTFSADEKKTCCRRIVYPYKRISEKSSQLVAAE
jgi:hypothetical protein